ncbi:CidA/LrgA family protein [Anaerosinus massiliensis]|uniref:CidA/LrgA family protein n=1 Tax=Massilibacillus massiliensis TaxID=1806837 RepID=UPI000DA5FECA|nr:CidA/LrgA family protein [Massilibacillus massiliensis]
MKILVQIGIVFLLVACADILSRLLPLAVPVSVIGILLLLACLMLNIIKINYIEDIANFFLHNMGFFFIAAGVSMIGKYTLIENILLQYAVITLISTLLTFAMTGIAVKLVLYLQNKMRKNKQHGTNH